MLERHVPHHDHVITSRGGEEVAFTDQALREGYGTIVAAGGDGTLSTVADRIIAHGRTDVAFGVLPSGTGNDFGRNIGLPGKDLEETVRILAEGRRQWVDVGRVESPCAHEDRDDSPRVGRHFLNLVGLGFDIAAVDAAKGARFLRGALLYKAAALQQLFRFPGFSATLSDDSGHERSGRALMITVSNGPFFGGGFPISPRATVQDGMLHSCFIGDAKPLRRLALFGMAGKGRHEGASEVEGRSATSFRLSFADPIRFEIDGEVFAASEPEIRLEIRKKALKVITP